MKKKISLIDWAKRRTHNCPDCGGTVPKSWVKMTAWCSSCSNIWRLRRHQWSWKYHWYYLTEEGKVKKVGFYIETSGVTGKVEEIVKRFNGTIVSVNEAREAVMDNTKGVVCVVTNRFFEAAGFAFDEKEFQAFTYPDDIRPKKFIIISREDAEKASGYKSGGDYR